MSAAWEGLLLVDKPSGPTSHDIVDRVRKATGQRRTGHAGTLDPMASGLLPLVLGRATRLVRFLPHSPKEYLGTLRLGLTTRSDDITGEVLGRYEGALPEEGPVQQAASTLRGALWQEPPAISARKVRGERLYRLARRGVAVQAAPSRVEVSDFSLQRATSPETYSFVSRVSAGTYIRALVRDLGAALGCGAVLESLHRSAIGPLVPDPRLALDRSAPADPAILRAALIPIDRMPLLPPALHLERTEEIDRFRHGSPIPVPPSAPDGEFLAVRAGDGRLLGIAERHDESLLPRVVLTVP